MPDTQSDDEPARSEFEDAKRSIDSVDRSPGDQPMNVATAAAAGGGAAARATAGDVGPENGEAPDAVANGDDLGMRANDELTDGDAVR